MLRRLRLVKTDAPVREGVKGSIWHFISGEKVLKKGGVRRLWEGKPWDAIGSGEKRGRKKRRKVMFDYNRKAINNNQQGKRGLGNRTYGDPTF